MSDYVLSHQATRNSHVKDLRKVEEKLGGPTLSGF